MRALRIIAASVMCGIILFPLYWMIVVALSSRAELLGGGLRLWPRAFTLENFDRALTEFPALTWLGNSVAIALVTSLITVTVNLLGGYAFAQLRFRGSSSLFLVALATLTLPVQVIMVPLFRIVTRIGLYGTYWAVILPTAASAFGLFLARQFILGIPRDVIEAARIDGASTWEIFRYMTFPHLRQYLELGALLGSIYIVQNFDAVFTITSGGLGTANLPYTIYQVFYTAHDYGRASAAGVVVVIGTIAIATLALRTVSSLFREENAR